MTAAAPSAIPSGARGALVYYAATLTTFLAASAAPTPLYRMYAHAWDLSPVAVTMVFAVYAVSLLATLLTVGSISDRVGRRPVIAAALALQLAGLVLFMLAGSATELVVARVVQGVATGAAISTISAGLIDCDARRGSLVSTAGPLVGMAVGAMGSGALVAYAPAPLHLVYAVLFAVHVVELALVARLPETNTQRSAVPHSFVPKVSVPANARRALLAVTPVSVATWALGGFCLSLLPAVVAAATGVATPMLGAVVVSVMNLSGAVAVVLFRDRPAHALVRHGTVAMGLGVAALIGGIEAGSAPAIVAAIVPAGAGFGATFLGCLRTLAPLVGPADRARLMSAYLVESYLAFSAPAVAAGFLAREIGVVATAEVYGPAVLVLVAAGFVSYAALLRRPAQAASAG
jgi:MFS family permease